MTNKPFDLTGKKVWVAGHKGMVGSAIARRLARENCTILEADRRALDLTRQADVEAWMAREKPDAVFIAAARVGGILANDSHPVEFLTDNLQIQTNIIATADKIGVGKLLFLGSSCIYPKLAPQPMHERDLLTGPLEPTNRPYALAKIAGIEMCWSYNRQYGTRFLAVMPTNLYGPNDNYDLQASHVIPALLRKFDEAKRAGAASVVVWGSGKPRREFMYSEDMAEACVWLMNLPDDRYEALLGSDESLTGRFEPPIVNIGTGSDVTIAELAELVRDVVGFRGDIVYDTSKPDGPPRKLLDVSRLSQAGWRARTPLREGLARAYASYTQSSPTT